jgi:hypothetical protein
MTIKIDELASKEQRATKMFYPKQPNSSLAALRKELLLFLLVSLPVWPLPWMHLPAATGPAGRS